MVCFVTGETGSGKTTLVTEVARRAQEQYTDLAVAVGQSNAQTGAEDANLPFREVLGQLTGDVDAKLAQGVITQENASRLKKLIGISAQVLVELGPDLIGVFVPGALLAAKAGSFVVKEAGWMDKQERLAGKQKKGPAVVDSGIQQIHVFEQYPMC
jgi:predicted ATPase